MSRALVAIAFLALCASAIAGSDWWSTEAHYDAFTQSNVVNEYDLCRLVGHLSGCSGCQHGTKNLCTWMTHFTQDPETKRSAEDAEISGFLDKPTHYHCVPKSRVEALLESNALTTTNDRWYVSTDLCPADPTKEPIVRERFDEGPDVELEVVSQYHTQYFDNEYADFSVVPWAVDRTAFYSVMGFARFGLGTPYHYDCNDVTNLADVAEHDTEMPGMSPILSGGLENERDKYCVRIALSAYLSSRCPQYGVAVSGICESFYKQIRSNCLDANAGPMTGFTGDSLALEAYNVVPDDTPYCLKSFPVKPSAKFEAMAGLNIPASKLADQTFWYSD